MNVPGLKLIPADHRQSPRMGGVITVPVAVIKPVVHDDHGMVGVAEWTPAHIIVIPVPVNPGRAPVDPGNPVPTEVEPPVPTSVVRGAPSPGFRRDPGPSEDRIPDPPSVIIRPPVLLNGPGNPDIAVRPLVDPAAGVVQFLLIFRDVRGQIGRNGFPAEEIIPGGVPAVECVEVGGVIRPGQFQFAVRSEEPFPGADDDGIILSRGFSRPLEDLECGLRSGAGIDPVEAFLEDIKGGVRRVDPDPFFSGEGVHPQKHAAIEQVKIEPVLRPLRKGGQLQAAVRVDPEIVLPAEMDLRLSVPGHERIARDKRKVDFAHFRAQVRAPVHGNIASDIVQTRDAVIIKIVRLGENHDGYTAQ